LVFEDGEFDIANPQFTLELPDAVQPVKLIKKVKPKQTICYYGGALKENWRE
jgi:hypothetical protein